MSNNNNRLYVRASKDNDDDFTFKYIKESLENINKNLVKNIQKQIVDVKYLNLLAPQATPKENVNIVSNYLITSLPK